MEASAARRLQPHFIRSSSSVREDWRESHREERRGARSPMSYSGAPQPFRVSVQRKAQRVTFERGCRVGPSSGAPGHLEAPLGLTLERDGTSWSRGPSWWMT